VCDKSCTVFGSDIEDLRCVMDEGFCVDIVCLDLASAFYKVHSTSILK